MQGQRTSHRAAFWKRNDVLFLIVALVLIALIATFRSQQRGVATISGLSLNESRDSVESKLGKPSFTGRYKVEYWSTKDRPQLNVTYDHDNRVHQLEGGTPEVNDIPVPEADIPTLQSLLGPPRHGGQGRALPGKGASNAKSDVFLSYPNHNLLIRRESGRNTFILFRSARK